MICHLCFVGMLRIWKIAPHPWKQNHTGLIIRMSILIVIVIGTGFMWWIYNNLDALPYRLPQQDRLLVWAEPQNNKQQ